MTHAPAARLKPHREKPLLHGHPWVFSGAISSWSATPAVGAVVDVLDHGGTWVGRGLAHPGAALAIRVYTQREEESLDEAFWDRRVAAAVALRRPLFPAGGDTDAYRVVFSESDGLSGLIVDRYADALSAKLASAALAPRLPVLLASLRRHTGITRIAVGAERDQLAREGLDAAAVEAQSVDAPAAVRIHESGLAYDVDLAGGQKTGFFLDQRENRKRVAAYAAGRSVLSAYCYTGGFELHAARAGAAQVTGIDSSAPALERARQHHALNGLAVPTDYREADVPLALRRFRDEARRFDLIVLDPPRFVNSAAQLEKGLRAYKDINLLALKLLAPGGVLATFTCSGLVGRANLLRAVQWAADDSDRTVRILETFGQPADHPVGVSVVEAEYLAGFLLHAE